MNDRYLYRAKRTDNGEWVEGFPSYNESGEVGEIEVYNKTAFVFHNVDPYTICQCTGLKDKNGKLIWENDVVVRMVFGEKVTGVVVWNDMGFIGFMLKVKKDDKISFYPIGRGQHDDDENMQCSDEIVGNIFDNLELLEAAKEAGKQGNQDVLMPAT